jgi:hypothetical protein
VEELALPPEDASGLYLARGAEVARLRPVMTGDVFDGVEIPGVDGGPGLALVLSHPCAMRDGAHVRDHIMMCAVRKSAPISRQGWLGNVDVMPLPDLLCDGRRKHRAEFDQSGRVRTALLDPTKRVACLDDTGIALLLQRHAFSHTRHAIEIDVVHKSVAHLLEEASLLEEWIEATCAAGGTDPSADDVRAAEADFDALMLRTDPKTGETNRARLRDPMTRAAVRRLVRTELAKPRLP